MDILNFKSEQHLQLHVEEILAANVIDRFLYDLNFVYDACMLPFVSLNELVIVSKWLIVK